jgi:hypothetical protein
MGVRAGQAPRLLGLFLSLAVFTGACTRDPSAPSDDRVMDLSAGKGVTTTDMSVSSAKPDSATQDTTLDVVINGSGFVSGTAASWALSGVQDPSQVRTNSTRYVNSRQLVANITISTSATIAKWDIVVAAAGKKGGIGTEAFAIKPKPNADTKSRVNYVIANQVDVAPAGSPANMQPAGIIGDGRLRDGSSAAGGDSEYQGNFCGTNGWFYSQPDPSGAQGSGLLRIQPGYGTNPCGEKRFYLMNLDGVWTRVDPLSQVPGVYWIGTGQAILSTMGFGIELPNCQIVKFDPAVGGDNVIVTRLDGGTGPRRWLLRSHGAHMGSCVALAKKGPVTWVPTGKKYYLPFSMTLTEIPYPSPTYP